MYFLSHMYSILEVLPDELLKEEILKPLIFGSWSPDAGYFPMFSTKLKIFSHKEFPPIHLFRKNDQEKKNYIIGWKLHLLCDELIHEKPFFKNNQPLCPKISRNKGIQKYYRTAKIHLGREVGLDLFIYNKLLKSSKFNLLFSRDFYCKPKITFPGYSKLQNYIYQYVNKFLPIASGESQLGNKVRTIIDFEFFNNSYIEEKIVEFLKFAQKECEKVVEKEFFIRI